MRYKLFLSGILLSVFSMSSMAACYITVDFSGVALEADSSVVWQDYNRWHLGYSTYLAGAISPGWNGKLVQDLMTASFVDVTGTNAPIDTLHIMKVGLTKDSGSHFVPVLLPENCNVDMHNNDTLYVSGILHVPGNNQDPYFEHLSCRLN